MKALTTFLLLLTCSFVCASAVASANTDSSLSENPDNNWTLVTSVQSSTSPKVRPTTMGSTMALLGGALFSALIISRRSRFSKD